MSTANVVYPTSAVDLQLSAGDYMVLARNGDGGSCGFCLKNTNGQVELVNPIRTTMTHNYLDNKTYRRSFSNRGLQQSNC